MTTTPTRQTPTPARPREATFAVLAALVAALLVCCGLSVVIPEGRGGVDHLLLPCVAFPVVWIAAALALFAAPDRRRARLVVAGLALVSLVATVADSLTAAAS